jgi:hypothetical protein
MVDINATEIAIQIGIAKQHINLSLNCFPISKTGKADECQDHLKTANLCLDNLGKILKEREFQE